jgi:hypothetical protein
MQGKILLAMQYWEGDKASAGKLLRFIADLEPKHCELADILLVNRFDCVPDAPAASYVGRKFNTFSYSSRRRGTGWPNGCNDLWFSTMEWVLGAQEMKKTPPYKAVFTFEADGAPLFQDWIRRLSFAWDRVQSKAKIYVAGAYIPPPIEHINGNMLLSCDHKFLNWLVRKVSGGPANVGWDYYLFNAFKRWGVANIPEIVSLYHTTAYTKERYDAMCLNSTTWVHGVKDNSLMECSREKWLGKREPIIRVDTPSRFSDDFNSTVSSSSAGAPERA